MSNTTTIYTAYKNDGSSVIAIQDKGRVTLPA